MSSGLDLLKGNSGLDSSGRLRPVVDLCRKAMNLWVLELVIDTFIHLLRMAYAIMKSHT
jgi:hypothetical protein